MKKLFFLLLLSLVTSVAINAQWAVGGSLSFNTTGGSYKTGSVSTDKTSTTTFEFSPMVGYFISEDLLVGGQLNFYNQKTKTPGNPERITKNSYFGISPFARYYALRFQKISVFGQAQLSLAFGKEKIEIAGNSSDGPKATYFGLSITPGIAYDLSDKIQLQASINLASLAFSSEVEKDPNGDKDITTSFNFGASTNNIINTNNFSIGAIIKL
jgi:outer membrane protein